MDMQVLYLDSKNIFFKIILFLFISIPAYTEDVNLENKFGIGSSNTGSSIEIRYWFTNGFSVETGVDLTIYDKNHYNYNIDIKTPVVLKKINNLFLEIAPMLSYYKSYNEYYSRMDGLRSNLTEIYSISLGFYSEYFFNNNLSVTLGIASKYTWETGLTNKRFYLLSPSPFVLGFKFYFN